MKFIDLVRSGSHRRIPVSEFRLSLSDVVSSSNDFHFREQSSNDPEKENSQSYEMIHIMKNYGWKFKRKPDEINLTDFPLNNVTSSSTIFWILVRPMI